MSNGSPDFTPEEIKEFEERIRREGIRDTPLAATGDPDIPEICRISKCRISYVGGRIGFARHFHPGR